MSQHDQVIKTGLTGRTILLHVDEAERYGAHLEEYEKEYRPQSLRERELVQSLADTQWRIHRVSALEMAIYAQGRTANQSSTSYGDKPPAIAAHAIDLEIFLKFEKQLRSLQLQEARLLRRYDKERKELLALQAARRNEDATAIGTARVDGTARISKRNENASALLPTDDGDAWASDPRSARAAQRNIRRIDSR